jgi:hypothetical protein
MTFEERKSGLYPDIVNQAYKQTVERLVSEEEQLKNKFEAWFDECWE